MTQPHNQIAIAAKEAVIRLQGANLQPNIEENITIQTDRLTDGLRNMRPDMIFEREGRDERTTEIREFSCQDGYISHDRDTLEAVAIRKYAKYVELVQKLARLEGEKLNVTPVIVSSMGAVYHPLLTVLQGIMGCNEKERDKSDRRMSNEAARGSMKIWRQHVKDVAQRGGAALEMITAMDGEMKDPAGGGGGNRNRDGNGDGDRQQ
jgi:hypothetical protein